MKFSHTVQFNAVPEWQQYYVAYSSLKKIIYQVEKDIFSVPESSSTGAVQSTPNAESSPLLNDSSVAVKAAKANQQFLPPLDEELKRTVDFYCKKEIELYTMLDKMIHQAHVLNFTQPDVIQQQQQGEAEGGSEVRIDIADCSPLIAGSLLIGNQPSGATNNNNPHRKRDAIQLSNKAIDLFVQLSELKNFVTLNYTGFAKILKKYDKVTNCSLARSYLGQTVQLAYPYCEETKAKLNSQIDRIHKLYSQLKGVDEEVGLDELRSHLREHLVWERNTVWRDMIGLERKVHAVELKSSRHVANSSSLSSATSNQTKTHQELINTTKSHWQPILTSLVCLSIFFYLYIRQPIISDDDAASSCLALLVFVSLLWATEVIPLFVTSLLVPFLVVTLRVLKSDDDALVRLDASQATAKIFSSMFSPVIMLLLGGFSLASALSKHHIAKRLANYVLSYAGTNPTHVLLANMMVATVASMWISNVAAPVLCFSLIQPLLRTLPSKSNYARSLIMGIALASNIGGMASPISSPQNIIALATMNPPPSWIQWFIVALPISLVGNLLVWALLIFVYDPAQSNLTTNTIRYTPEPLTWTQRYVIFVTVLTIILWCFAHQLQPYIGDMGVIAILPILLLFGLPNILSKDDFNNFLWTVIILAMGGIALGTAVKSSGLLLIISHHVQHYVYGLSLWQVMCVFCGFTLVSTTFISHTVGAVIILPIVQEIGLALPADHARLLVMGSVLMCSCAMGLPVSGFPNMNAIMMEDETGIRYLKVKDFLRSGVPASLVLYLVITTLGYGILLLIGF